MPIYEYRCTSCGHRTDIVHGINDPGPAYCPACGAEATMRKQFAPPAIHYKGSGWAKKDRGGAGGARTQGTSAGKSPNAEPGAAAASTSTSPGDGDGAKPEKASNSAAGTSAGSGE
jgi:putative FmdB family regulatory protein